VVRVGERLGLLGDLTAIPKDEADAVIRELVGMVPVLGDLFMLAEALRAFAEGRTVAGLVYLVNVLPGPPLPGSHLLVLELARRGGGS
jgi:hypothetical protein